MELDYGLSTAGTAGGSDSEWISRLAAESFGSAALTVDDIALSGTCDKARRRTFSGPSLQC